VVLLLSSMSAVVPTGGGGGGGGVTSSVLVASSEFVVPSFTTQSMVRLKFDPPPVGSPLLGMKLYVIESSAVW
jgi:hypothetical protein